MPTPDPRSPIPDPRAPSHYSYALYADRDMAERFEASRFGGPIGALLAETQERVLAEFAGAVEGRDALDVGTGAGRAAIALARRGARAVGVDPSRAMLDQAERRAAEERAAVTFAIGDAHALQFPDRSFDLVVSLRVLMHTPDWRRCVGELCRTSRRAVIIDYPAQLSAAALQAAARRVRASLGQRVEAYRVFTEASIRAAFRANGFDIVRVHRQFVLPIALHKAVGSRAATERVERLLAGAGLLWLAGSPVTVLAERCES